MADAEAADDGPDLARAGIAWDELADGVPVRGHVDDDAVLLVRRGDEAFAVGAKCTHYEGPLDQGIIVGETVRCPWHHAAFNLRTGDAERAPALNPLPCWHVERRDGRVWVTGKRTRDPLAPATSDVFPRDLPRSVVIVGAGAAGTAAAEMLRRSRYTGPVLLVDGNATEPVDRPNLSKDYLAGDAPEEWVPLRPPGFFAEHGIERVDVVVDSLDLGARQLRLADGRTLDYGALLLATGAEPVRLDVAGHDLPHVHILRTLADSRSIAAAARPGTRAVVLGASFIGLEVAAALRARDVEVHVAAPDAVPLERVMGPALGAMIRAIHEEHGIAFHLGRKARAIDAQAVTLDDGTRLLADLVVVGIGVRPRLALAEQAGLAMDRGVAVNEYLETSAPGVYAAGDIARWPDPHSGERIRVEHWVVAERQGQTAARNILAGAANAPRERFDAVPFFWSQHYDLSIRYVGHAERWDAAPVAGSAEQRDCSVAFRAGGHTLAVASVKRDQEHLEAERLLEQNDEAALGRLIAG